MTEKSQEWIKETSEDKYTFDQGLYIDQCLLFINFLLRKKQWSGINSADYQRWLNNFNQIENGKYIRTDRETPTKQCRPVGVFRLLLDVESDCFLYMRLLVLVNRH